jgi:hypothetical protein
MRSILVFSFALVISASSYSQTNAYSLQVTGNNAQQYPLANYQGQKIMFVILPTTQTSNDSAFIARVDSIALAYPGALKTFAVPSYEDGYYADSSSTLMQWYQSSLDTSIVISQPLYTHIASGAQQDSLFSWLTHSAQNTMFDYEISGTGTMFFLNAQGGIFGIIGSEGEFSNKALNRMLP